MSEFILVWVMMSSYWNKEIQYSPPVKTLEDCERIYEAAKRISIAKSICVQVNMPRKVQEK